MKNTQIGVNIGWEMFRQLFLEKYLPMIEKRKMKLEFM